MKTYKDLVNSNKYIYHHSALEKGYISVKRVPFIVPYSGRFGTGYKAYIGNKKSNGYTSIEYWIEK